jgi:hypothetical protein
VDSVLGEVLVDVLNVQVQIAQDPFGAVNGGFVKLAAHICEMKFVRMEEDGRLFGCEGVNLTPKFRFRLGYVKEKFIDAEVRRLLKGYRQLLETSLA